MVYIYTRTHTHLQQQHRSISTHKDDGRCHVHHPETIERRLAHATPHHQTLRTVCTDMHTNRFSTGPLWNAEKREACRHRVWLWQSYSVGVTQRSWKDQTGQCCPGGRHAACNTTLYDCTEATLQGIVLYSDWLLHPANTARDNSAFWLAVASCQHCKG